MIISIYSGAEEAGRCLEESMKLFDSIPASAAHPPELACGIMFYSALLKEKVLYLFCKQSSSDVLIYRSKTTATMLTFSC